MRSFLSFLPLLFLVPNSLYAVISPASLPDGTEGINYPTVAFTSDKVWASDPSVRWRALNAPPGITIDSKGKYGGKPTKAGNYSVTISVSIAEGTRLILKDSILIPHSINSTVAPEINQAVLPRAKFDARYQPSAGFRLTASGGVPFPSNSRYPSGYMWETIRGAGEFQNLPAGMTLSSAGVISGVPTSRAPIPASARTYVFRVKITDFAGKFDIETFTLIVDPADPPEIVTQCPLPEGLEVFPYPNFTLRGTKGKPPYRWSIEPLGNFAPGLRLDNNTGVVSGRPTRHGTYNFTLVLRDANGFTVNKTCSITIRPAPEIIVKPIFPCARVGGSACDEIEARGGDQPYTWTATGFPGIIINATSASKARICGNFTQAGNFTISVTARDKTGRLDTEQFTFQVRPALALTNSCPLEIGVQNSSYSTDLTAIGGKTPYAWALVPPNRGLPPGLTLNSTTGRISGTPGSSGNFTFAYKVTDSCGHSVSGNCSLTINPPLAQPSCSPPCITVGVPLNPTSLFSASGGKPPYAYDIPTTIPPGLNFTTDGILSGTPTSAGNFTISTTIRDSLGNSRPAVCVLSINDPLQITTLALPPAKMGEFYSAGLATTGGFGQKNWTLVPPNNTLPSNLSLDSLTGIISGIPQTTGEFKINLAVMDSCGSGSNTTAEIEIFVSDVGSSFLPCGSSANAGGQGRFNYIVDLGNSNSTFSFFGNAYGIPDRFVLRFANNILLDTGSFSGTVNQTFLKSNTQRWLTIETDAPFFGTAWTFTISCATPSALATVAAPYPTVQSLGAFSSKNISLPLRSLVSIPSEKFLDLGLIGTLQKFSASVMEVTANDYCKFLNSVASNDLHKLYSEDMIVSGISRSGNAGSYSYSVDSSFEDRPVTYVSWFDAVRYANWLANGKPSGAQDSSTTEDGTYSMAAKQVTRNSINPNTGAAPTFWLLNESEWHASAYVKSDASGLWTYPTQSHAAPDSSGANLSKFANFGGAFGETTPVGFFDQSPGPFGTFDQAGNVREWTETLDASSETPMRIIRGGSWADPVEAMRADESHVADPTLEDDKTGFRIGGAP